MAGETLSGDLGAPDPALARAQTRVVGVQGIAPTLGAQAQIDGPTLGLHPDVALQSAPVTSPAAATQRQQATIASSSHLQNFLNTANDAQVATVKDDLRALAKIGADAQAWAQRGGPIGDWAKALGGVWQQAQTDYHNQLQNGVPLNPLENSLVKVPLGLAGSTFAPIQHLLASAINLPTYFGAKAYENAGLGQVKEVDPWTQAQAQANLGLWLLGPKVLKDLREPPPVTGKEAPPFDLQPPTIEGKFNVKDSTPAPPAPPPVEGVPPVGVHPGVDGVRGMVAEADLAHVEALQESVAAAKTHALSPGTMEEFLGSAGANTSVTLDPEHLTELALQGHEPFPELRNEIQRAALGGDSVVVPLSRYLTATAGQPFAGDLNKSSTFREDGISVRDSKENPTSEEPKVPAATVEPPADLNPIEAARTKDLAASYDDELTKVLKAQYLNPLFKDAKSVGMTEPQFARYSAKIEEGVQKAVDKLHDRAVKEITRERKPEFKAKVEEHLPAATGEIEGLPAVRAMRDLSTKGMKLDRDLTSNFWPNAHLPESVLKNNANHPDDAAEVLGFPSGGELVHALADLHSAVVGVGAKNLGEFVKLQAKHLAETRARTDLGWDITPESIHEAASEAVAAPNVTDFLAWELKHLAPKGLPLDLDRLKAEAKADFARMTVGKVINIPKMEGRVFKFATKAENALGKGKFSEAFIRKQQQFLRHLELRQAHDFLKQWGVDQRRFSKWAKKDLIGGMEPAYSNQVLSALGQMGFNVRRDAAALVRDLRGVSLEDFTKSTIPQGADDVYAAIPQRPLKSYTTADYSAVSRMVNSLAHQGRAVGKIIANGKAMEREAAAAELHQQLVGRSNTLVSLDDIRHPDAMTVLDNFRRGADAWNTRPEQVRYDLDARDPNGIVNRTVTLPLQDRKGWRNQQYLHLAEQYKALNAEMGKGFPEWMKLKVKEPAFLDPNGDPWFTRKVDVLGAALHWGTESNRNALLKGLDYGREVPLASEDAVAAMLDRHMTPQAWKFIEAHIKMFDHYKNDIADMYERINGVSTPMVETTPYTVGAHSSAGGYIPISRDPRYLPTNVASSMEFEGDGNYFRATPVNSHAKARTNAEYPVSLDPRLMHARMYQVVHDLAFREALINARKFLGDDRVQNSISRHYGPEYAHGLLSWLQDVAADQTFNPRDQQAIRAFLDYTNANAISNLIGFSLQTVMKHAPTAFIQSVQEVGLGSLMGAYKEWFSDFGGTLKRINAEAPEIRDRLMNSSEAAQRSYLKLVEHQGWLSEVQQAMFHMVAASDQFSAIPTYMAAKKAFLSNPATAENAIALAQQSVRQAHGSAGVVDAPASLRQGKSIAHKAWAGANQFMTFMNHMYNRQREISQDFGFAGNKRDIGAGVGKIFSFLIGVGLIEHEVKRAFGSNDSAVNDIIDVPFLGFPIARDVEQLVAHPDQTFPHESFLRMAQSVGMTANDIHNWAEHKHVSPHWIKHTAETAGYLVPGVPGAQAGRTLEGAYDLHLHHPASPLTVLQELMAGAPSKKGHH